MKTLDLPRRTAIAALALSFALPALAQQSRPTPSGPQSKPVTASEAYSRIRAGQTFFIDTREEVEKSAGVPDGVNAEIVYRMSGAEDQKFIADVLRAAGGKHDADITLICTSGIRSAAAQKTLEDAGFTNAHIITGGFQAWLAANLPRK